jgi:hypothetical protein
VSEIEGALLIMCSSRDKNKLVTVTVCAHGEWSEEGGAELLCPVCDAVCDAVCDGQYYRSESKRMPTSSKPVCTTHRNENHLP